MIYEGIAALVTALIVGAILFRFFFDGWRDYLGCYYPRGFLFASYRPDAYDRARGFFFNVICGGVGVGAFYCIHKVFG
jgi:hypothetical protein